MTQSQLNNKVLYLSYDGLSDPLGQSQILPYLIGLAKKGYSISVITFEKSKNFEQLELSIKNVCEASNLKWYPLRYHKNPPVLSTLYDVWKLFRKAKQLQNRYTFKIVHCRSYITSLVGFYLKRKYSLRFIFDMRGFWADERVEGELWNLRNPMYNLIYKFFKAQEKKFLNESDYVISLTESAKQIFDQWNIKAPVTVIPCCVDINLFNPDTISIQDREMLKKKLGIKNGDFILMYLGSWGTWYLTEAMLAYYKNLLKHFEKSKFLIVSPDPVNLDRYECADSVIVRKAQRDEIPLYISIASAAILFIKPTFSKKASSATKVGELLAMNVPIITNPGWGDIENIVKDCGGHLVSMDHINSTFKVIDQTNTRSYCREFLSLDTAIKRYAYVYECLV